MLQKTITTKQAMRYNRQIVLADFDLDKQERLLNANVLVIGVGGLGCAAAQYLVASGVGKITLVDDDTVDSSNLQRQVLHGENDIGINKGLSAKASLQLINSDCAIDVMQSRLEFPTQNTLLNDYDLVVDCSDNLSTRNALNQACYSTATPLVSGAAIRMEGQLICVIPKQKTACYCCLSQYFAEQNLTCVESGIMSPVVGVIGSMQALEAIKILTAFGQSSVNQVMLFDGMTANWQAFKVPKSATCKICAV